MYTIHGWYQLGYLILFYFPYRGGLPISQETFGYRARIVSLFLVNCSGGEQDISTCEISVAEFCFGTAAVICRDTGKYYDIQLSGFIIQY